MKYSYYPGCTLHSTAIEYGWSTEAVCEALGIDLVEIEDWNCCGASSAHSLDPHLALALPTRDLMRAQAVGADIVMPCAACYGRMAAADHKMRSDSAWRKEMEAEFQTEYIGAARPRTLVDVLGNDLSPEALAAKVKRPLNGLRTVSYYGCLLIRPPDLTNRWDDPEHPVVMDRILKALGAEPVQWAHAVECCGASLALDRADVVTVLSGRIVQGANDAEADCIVCACPLCQANLDSRQKGISPKVPVLYITELMGIALDLPGRSKWFAKHLVDPRPMLRRKGLE
ncbi:MAG: CoB--CoM heterodisulfide reductase iron-sulfur subunit B family protein [Anaerolineae bacterium]|nr:CoB--CoM heterodisulfide reductase iron-sulfur subunit B family protein [Anaerolineae bacterium]